MEIILTAENIASAAAPAADDTASKALADHILAVLEENSAQDTITIDIAGKSSVADYMIVTSGRSNRHVGALSDYVQKSLRELGHKSLGIEGKEANDWVLIDVGDVILHIFRPEVRVFYNLEKIWSVPLPDGLRGMVHEDHEDHGPA